MLKSIAKTGRTVICSIHQPSALDFTLFDKVFVLADGKCAYQGSSLDTVNYLGTFGLVCPNYHNPADYRKSVSNASNCLPFIIIAMFAVMEVINGEHGDYKEKLINRMSEVKEVDYSKSTDEDDGSYRDPIGTLIDINSNNKNEILKPVSALSKIYLLSARSYMQQHRDWVTFTQSNSNNSSADIKASK